MTITSHHVLPLSPEAAGLGRYGDTPVSLYTGVPSIEIPLYTLQTSNLEVPVKLQYHGGGVRLDQKAAWVGLGWSLAAGGVVTHVNRGILDDATNGFTNGAPAPPTEIPRECGVRREAGTTPFRYVQAVLEGRMDSQADLYNFNFQSYSGSFVLDRQGVPHLISQQPLQVQRLAGGAGWQFTTPDGAVYKFEATEVSDGGSSLAQGVSAWYLTSISTRFHEQISFIYQDYSTFYDYSPNYYPLSPGTSRLPTATTGTWYHTCGDLEPDLATCEAEATHLPSFADRPAASIQGKYLRRILYGPVRLDFFSGDGRPDGDGLRRLDSVQIKYLPDSMRFKTFRFAYDYPDARLALTRLTEVGYAPTGPVAPPPYRFFYTENLPSYGLGVSTAPGSPCIDRWGYYNGQPNRLPFLAYKDQYVDLPGADREVNPTCVLFGLLRRIIYPTGGQTDYDFESNDFSNLPPSAFYTTAQQQAFVCVSNPDPDNTDLPSCNGDGATLTFRLTHAQRVTFHWETVLDATGTPLTDTEVAGTLTDSLGVCTNCAIAIQATPQGAYLPVSLYLTAGTYTLQLHLATARFVRAGLNFSYEVHRPQAFRGKLGGGTRIQRITTYDGLDHRNDQVKEYYYRNEAGTRSTGRLSHDLAFNSWVDTWNLKTGGYIHERFLQRSARDIIGTAGTTPPTDVGYDTVTVIQRANGHISKSQSIFVNEAPTSAILGDNFSIDPGYVSRYNYFEQNGRLRSTLTWRVEEGADPWSPAACKLMQRTDNVYRDSVVARVDNLLIAGSFSGMDSTHYFPCRAIKYNIYTTQCFWSTLCQRVDRRYSQTDTTSLATVTRWQYGSLMHQQPIWEESQTEAGTWTRQRFKYPGDYAPAVTEAALLRQQQLLTTPVETQRWHLPGPGQPGHWTGGTLAAYAPTSSGGVVQTRTLLAELPAPQATLTEPTNPAGLYTAFAAEPAYRLRARYAYYGTGELAEQRLVAQPPTSYLWGYDQHHEIARAQNAGRARIAATSFEPNATGRWQYDSTGTHRVAGGYTGRWAYQLNGQRSVSLAAIPAGDYELSFWVQGAVPPRFAPATGAGLVVTLTNGSSAQAAPQLLRTATGGWRYYRARLHFTGAGRLDLEAAAAGPVVVLDEVRLGPQGARLTSYTYDLLAGMTSQTGPDGRTIFYEYDALGRLVRTRDEQGRILGQQQYHYAGQ